MVIGIIGAMEEEVRNLREQMKEVERIEKASMQFYKGNLCGQEVVLVRSGIGKVNAAICTQLLIDVFQVTSVINTGIAGSLDAQVDIGDMVISDKLVYHDVEAIAFGYDRGQVPRMDTLYFPADTELVRRAKQANEDANPDIQTFVGCIASGDQFVASREIKDEIVRLFAAKCVEMEGTAIAHVAYLNQVPCVVIRAISDKADESASMDYPAFEKQAIIHSVKLVCELLKGM
jgi:5''-methylthioadenosine/S-adenosylhomocysteine nucleosidase